MKARAFADIEQEFTKRINRIVWCNVATVDPNGRPRSRILHPIWEGATGWIATGRNSPKAAHLASTPFVSLCYWDQQHEQIYVACRAAWEEDAATKTRIWKLLAEAPPPMGYDPGAFWKDASDPEYGLLKLTPWRVELHSLQDLFSGTAAQVWTPG